MSKICKVRYAFGIFFISISIGITLASVFSEIAYIYHAPSYLYPVIWIGILVSSISSFKLKNPTMFKDMSIRFKQSVSWPTWAKIINGLSWSLPFMSIGLYPMYYQYLVLLGIGLGNISTYVLSKRFEKIDHGNGIKKEQLLIGSISLIFLPIAIILGFLFKTDVEQMLIRLFIAFAYAVGGLYILLIDPE